MHIENDRTTTALTIFKTRSLVADTSLVVLARAPAAPARARTSLQKTHLFLSFPYDCPEPVSAKWSFLHLKWRFSKKKGVFAHHRGSANSYHIQLPTTPAGKKRHNETTRARTVESVRVQFVFREPVFASKGNTMQICFPFVCPKEESQKQEEETGVSFRTEASQSSSHAGSGSGDGAGSGSGSGSGPHMPIKRHSQPGQIRHVSCRTKNKTQITFVVPHHSLPSACPEAVLANDLS